MNLNQWAIKWGIPFEAVEDLRQLMTGIDTESKAPVEPSNLSEAAVQNLVRAEASKKGLRLWRNNVGAYSEANPPSPGTRWGLLNDSPAINKVIKSSDLIGIRPVIITPEMVGHTLGQFVAREVKPAAWRFSGTEREVAQLRFIELINGFGGDANFCNREGTLWFY